MENSKPNWRFCVVGNIAKTHFDDEGISVGVAFG